MMLPSLIARVESLLLRKYLFLLVYGCARLDSDDPEFGCYIEVSLHPELDQRRKLLSRRLKDQADDILNEVIVFVFQAGGHCE